MSAGISAPVLTLAIDASTYVGTVAVWDENGAMVEGTAMMRGVHEERLMPAVAETLARGGVPVERVRRIVCGGGPGSFTSLRIAAAIAKGIAASNGPGCALCTVSSLALLVSAEDRRPGRYLAALDAMRGEWYVQCFEVGGDSLTRVAGARGRVGGAALEEMALEHGASLLRAGTPETATAPHARGVASVAPELLEIVDLGSWEPDYGRLAEAQVKWEAQHGRPLAGGAS